ncbi:MAG: hypothetical protein ACKV2U_26910 [Bryobacteraceae bacterium]
MTVTIELSPEREAALGVQAEMRGLTIQQWLLQLAEQSAPLPSSEQPAGKDDRPIWEIFVDCMKDVPREAFAALPRDGASQIDHYVYGHPKR